MRDAIGGSISVFYIAVFIVIVSGYLAFSVTYNKAFRVKNKIINLLEIHKIYQGEAEEAIEDYIKEVGYSVVDEKTMGISCSTYSNSSAYICKNGYCITWISETGPNDEISKGYYKVTTAVRVDIPIINKIMPMFRIFDVSGDTITIYDQEGSAGLTPCG